MLYDTLIKTKVIRNFNEFFRDIGLHSLVVSFFISDQLISADYLKLK